MILRRTFGINIAHIKTAQNLSMRSIATQNWKSWEDDLLKDWVQHNGKQWTQFSQKCLPHRKPIACSTRWMDVVNPEISTGPFNGEEIALLTAGVNEFGPSSWKAISKKYLPHRSPRRLALQWNTTSNPDFLKRERWSAEDDRLLLQGVKEYGNRWTKISTELIPWRSRTQIRQRYNGRLSPDVLQQPWSQEERDLLLRRTLVYGEDWAKVAEGLAGRTAKQCEESWCTKVNPALHGEDWSSAETNLFWRLIRTHGGSWTKVADHLPGRSRISLSQKFQDALQKELHVLFGEEYVAKLPHETARSWKVRLAEAMVQWLDSKLVPKLAENKSLQITKSSKWTSDELRALKKEIDVRLGSKYIDWEAVSRAIPGRTPEQCRYHYQQQLDRDRYTLGHWTEEEDEKLYHLVKKHGHIWQTISLSMKTRSPTQCNRRWVGVLQYRQDHGPSKKIFTRMSEEEVRMLFEGVQMYGRDWKAVSSTYLPHRTPQQCMRAYSRQRRSAQGFQSVPGTGRWSDQEDKILRYALSQYSTDNEEDIPWVEVAMLVDGRNARQCRERWLFRLKEGLRKGNWTHEEEMALLELVQRVRPTLPPNTNLWHEVAKRLGTERSKLSCATKFASLQKAGSRFALL